MKTFKTILEIDGIKYVLFPNYDQHNFNQKFQLFKLKSDGSDDCCYEIKLLNGKVNCNCPSQLQPCKHVKVMFKLFYSMIDVLELQGLKNLKEGWK